MARAASIHIGVNQPHGRLSGHPLYESENLAWRMAVLAERAGYDSMQVLRGPAATRQALHDALTGAAGSLGHGDTLFVSFAGHGSQEADMDCDEGHGWDEAWCLHDGVVVDDKLAGSWRLFEPGVRIVVLSESCYGGGVVRTGDEKALRRRRPAGAPTGPVMRGGGSATRSAAPEAAAPAGYVGSCIAEGPRDTHGIRASLLLLSASAEDQPAREGLFSTYLLEAWNDGAYRGSYCDLYRKVRAKVMTERCSQHPQILMLGAGDPAFPLAPAFHVGRHGTGRSAVYR